MYMMIPHKLPVRGIIHIPIATHSSLKLMLIFFIKKQPTINAIFINGGLLTII